MDVRTKHVNSCEEEAIMRPISIHHASQTGLRCALCLLLLVGAVGPLWAQMNGSYTINGAVATGGTNYQTFSAAVADLAALGISGDVGFLVAAGVYNELVTIPALTYHGASHWRVTFDGGTGNAATRVIEHTVTTNFSAVVTLDGADHVTLRNLTVRSLHNHYGACVKFTNSADHNEIAHCRLVMPPTSTSIQQCGVLATSATALSVAGDYGRDNLIRNNVITGGGMGIAWNGYANNDYTESRGNHFIENSISNFHYRGFYLSRGGASVIRGNTIVQRETSYQYEGIATSLLTDGAEISGNLIVTRSVGLTCDNMNLVYNPANPNHRARIFNNMIIVLGEWSAQGIAMQNPGRVDVMFNSISVKVQQQGNQSYGYFSGGFNNGPADARVLNNIISMESPDVMNNVFVGNPAAYSAFDYNMHECIGAPEHASYVWGPWPGVQHQTLGDLQTALPAFHQHSFTGSPAWAGLTDLHTSASNVQGAGVAIAGVTVDFDGDLRATPPGVGADESSSCMLTCPADVLATSDPTTCGAYVTFMAPSAEGCGDVVVTPPSGSFFPVGSTTVLCAAASGATCTFTVTVRDAAPPTLTTMGTLTLWPPDHSYVTIPISQMLASLADNCTPLSIDDVRITGATSDETEYSVATGSGQTIDDIVIAPDCRSVMLRRERDGSGDGRVYTVELRVSDAAGNGTTGIFRACVPHNSGGGCTEGSVRYLVTSSCGTPKTIAPDAVAEGVVLAQNHPNPFNPSTIIRYILPEQAHVRLRVTDALGRLIATLKDAVVDAGSHDVVFEASGLPGGVYVATLESGGRILHRRMMLLK
jgi:hypothetical protein